MLDASYSYACKVKKMHVYCVYAYEKITFHLKDSVCPMIICANRSDQTHHPQLGEPYQANLDTARESSSQTPAFVGTARFLM